MSDEFYLPEETVEWIAQKKSELLAWVIQHRHDDDIPFEEFTEYTERVSQALVEADESWQQVWDGHNIQISLKQFEEETSVWLFVISLKAPVANEDEDSDVLVPVLVLPTKHTGWLKKWLSGEAQNRKQLH
jgi:hypothetical protein